MNKFYTLAAAAALVLAACGEAPAPEATTTPAETAQAEVTPAVATLPDGEYTVDAAGSEIVWIGRKVTGEHKGNISLTSGTFRVTNGLIAGGSITMDMKSMTNTDLDAEYGGKLLGHLASADFFDTENFPTASFEIRSFVPNANGGTVKGMLTIKGITQQHAFEVITNSTDGNLELRGMMKVDRTAFDIKYGSGSFFDDLGDKAIDDLFELGFFIKANA